MALELNKEMPTGVTGNYWKIAKLVLEGEVECLATVQLYKDAAARAAGKLPLETLEYSFRDSENPCLIAEMDTADQNPFFLVYEKLKTLPEFTGALDV